MIGTGPRYEVVCRLGGGGMGDVYLARFVGPAGFERLLAIKQLPPQLVANPVAAQALVDEARIAATLSHTNIVQVHDVEIGSGQVSIVMEYLHGRDVRQLLERVEVLPLDQAVAIGLGVLAALHHAHERVGPDGEQLEIVHRDVSPHNVIVTFDGAVKLVDFGIARARSRLGENTEQGVTKGKPGYMAPEQLRGRPIDRRTDVWGASVLLYEMTTGSRPFPDDDPYRVIEDDAQTPTTRVPGFAAALESIILRGLARDPAARYATAADMQRDLEAFARARSLDVSQFGLARWIEGAFAPELEAWRRAERDGVALADHLAASSRRDLPLPAPAASNPSARVRRTDPTTPLPPPRRRRSAPAIAVAALLATTVGVALWMARAAGDAASALPPPVPQPTSIETPRSTAYATAQDDPPPASSIETPIAPKRPVAPNRERTPAPDAATAPAAAPPTTPPSRTDPDAPLPR